MIQINLNKCELAQANLATELSQSNKTFLGLIQQPHFTKSPKIYQSWYVLKSEIKGLRTDAL